MGLYKESSVKWMNYTSKHIYMVFRTVLIIRYINVSNEMIIKIKNASRFHSINQQ
jgi:hypothetical protein